MSIYLIFKESVDFKSIEYIGLKLYSRNRNILLNDKFYTVNDKFNKISLKIEEKFENRNEFKLEVGVYIKEKNMHKYLYSSFNLTIL